MYSSTKDRAQRRTPPAPGRDDRGKTSSICGGVHVGARREELPPPLGLGTLEKGPPSAPHPMPSGVMLWSSNSSAKTQSAMLGARSTSLRACRPARSHATRPWEEQLEKDDYEGAFQMETQPSIMRALTGQRSHGAPQPRLGKEDRESSGTSRPTL